MALCGYIAAQRGLPGFDGPVGELWPEFAVNGKEDTTIRDLFTHRSGLVVLDTGSDAAGFRRLDTGDPSHRNAAADVAARHGVRLPRADLRMAHGRYSGAQRVSCLALW